MTPNNKARGRFPKDLFPLLHSHTDSPLTQHNLERAFQFPMHGIGQLSRPKIDLFVHKKQFFDRLTGNIHLPITATKRYRIRRSTVPNMGYVYERCTYYDDNHHPTYSWYMEFRTKVTPTDIVEFQHNVHDTWTTMARLHHRIVTHFLWSEQSIEVYETWALIDHDKENPVLATFHVHEGKATSYLTTQKKRDIFM